MINWLYDLFPFTVAPAAPFREVGVGEVFTSPVGTYRLLELGINEARVVRWNWWTKLWWGGKIEHRQN